MENESLSKEIRGIIQFYYKETNIEPIKLNVEIVQDLYKRRLELAIDDKDRENIISSREFTRNSNGTIVIPESIDDVSYILVSINTIDNYQFVSTIIHELTHIHDIYNFYIFNKDKYVSLREMDNYKEFNIYILWSEYNARRKGYYFYRKIMHMIFSDTNKSESEQIEHILNIECLGQMEYLKNQLFKYENNKHHYIYNIIQFIGRFSVWNDLFPNDFNVNTLPNELLVMFGDKIINLYEFLYKNKNFDDIKLKINELDHLLGSFVKNK